MKSIIISISIITLSTCNQIQGFLSGNTVLPISNSGITMQQPISTGAYNPYSTWGNAYYYPQQHYMPSIDYSQWIASINGVQHLNTNSVSSNSQNAIANTYAANGSNANTSMNNNAYSNTVNGVGVK